MYTTKNTRYNLEITFIKKAVRQLGRTHPSFKIISYNDKKL